MTKTTKRIMLISFVFLQIIAYMFLNFIKIANLKYLCFDMVLLSFIFALIMLNKNSQTYFQIGAFVFTLIADFCMLVVNKWLSFACIIFFISQIFYAFRVYYLAYYPKERLIQLGVRFLVNLITILLVIIILNSKTTIYFFFWCLGYVNILVSLVFALLHFKESKQIKFLALALTMLGFASMVVGSVFLCKTLIISAGTIYKIANLQTIFTNLFYPLSQVLFCFSIQFNK